MNVAAYTVLLMGGLTTLIVFPTQVDVEDDKSWKPYKDTFLAIAATIVLVALTLYKGG